MAKKEYRNSVRTERWIQAAVVELLKDKKDYFSITVSDVCRQANINRGTFYHHYANIAEVANAIEMELMEALTKDWNETKLKKGSIADFIRMVTEKIKENEVAYKSIVDYIPNYFFEDMKGKFIHEIEPDFRKNGTLSDYAQATISILSSGIVSLYLDYFNARSKMSLDQIQDCSIRVVDNVLRYRPEE
jgi:AcrR family transcriptional regulator